MKVKRTILIITLPILLTACSSAPVRYNEFNKFIVGEIEINDNIGYDKYKRRIIGQTTHKNGICKFKLPTVRWLHDVERMCVWGHELMHCVLGTFHTDDEANTCY